MQDSTLLGHCNTCNSHGPVVIYVAKLFPTPDCSSFDAFGRVFSGSVKAGDKVRVLGQSYTPDDEEDSAVAQVSKVWVFMGRYRIPVTKGMAGVDPSCLQTLPTLFDRDFSGWAASAAMIDTCLVFPWAGSVISNWPYKMYVVICRVTCTAGGHRRYH